MKLALPKLEIKAKAEILSNNLPEFEKWFEDAIEDYKYELLTDEDFTKAKSDIKELDETEKILKQVKQDLIEGSADLKTVTDKLDDFAEQARQIRLARNKEVKTRDEAIKAEIVKKGWSAVDSLSNHTFEAEFQEAIKGKRSFETMRQEAESLAEEKNAHILRNKAVIETFKNTHGASIAPDHTSLEICTSEEVLREKLNNRVEALRVEEERKKLQAEQEAVKATEPPKEQSNSVRQPLPISPTPSVNKVHSPETPEEEWARFLKEVPSIFMSFKNLRCSLTHKANISRSSTFADTLNDAWKEVTK